MNFLIFHVFCGSLGWEGLSWQFWFGCLCSWSQKLAGESGCFSLCLCSLKVSPAIFIGFCWASSQNGALREMCCWHGSSSRSVQVKEAEILWILQVALCLPYSIGWNSHKRQLHIQEKGIRLHLLMRDVAVFGKWGCPLFSHVLFSNVIHTVLWRSGQANQRLSVFSHLVKERLFTVKPD